MRGTRTPASRESVQNGIIPAYAGNTSLSGNLEDFGGDHPRVCGEHVRNDRAIEARAGSSPRMRGTHADWLERCRILGIIPAYAGNTPRPTVRRTWCRIIPAYAGNTPRTTSRSGSARDHPRVCGEHSSGPLVMVHAARIIPAYAGNTAAPNTSGLRTGDHPRVCGEHSVGVFVVDGRVGSSPRMRGTQLCWFAHAPMAGIIPAYAGNTHQNGVRVRTCGDHPRVCGEHVKPSEMFRATSGSSPRMRGTRKTVISKRLPHGIIPAYAGNTLRDYSNFVVSKFMSFVFHLV